jgi:hypothetical protein
MLDDGCQVVDFGSDGEVAADIGATATAAAVVARAATVERSLNAPPIRITGVPEPTVSTAIVLPSVERMAVRAELVMVVCLSIRWLGQLRTVGMSSPRCLPGYRSSTRRTGQGRFRHRGRPRRESVTRLIPNR